MKVYKDSYDWMIAEDWDDLKALFIEIHGEGDWEEDEWHEVDPLSPLTVYYRTVEECPAQSHIQPGMDGLWYATMRTWEWADIKGRGYLSSTEE